MRTLLLATRNPGKVQEIKAILNGVRADIHSLIDMPHLPDIIEDGATLEENALKKAREIFRIVNMPVLSDDTGLEVFHLGMKPGVHSARYAGEHVSYKDNYRKLLHELHDIPHSERGAQFRCVAVFIDRGIETVAEGKCKGVITTAPRGKGGFGYDPVFIPQGFDQTFAELPLETKNRISHRASAFFQMKESLLAHFS